MTSPWMHRAIPALSAALLVLVSTASICGTPIDQQGCSDDLACNPGGGSFWKCDLPTGNCLCRNDQACDPTSEFCNPQGFCQARSGCFSNEDCTAPFLCDVTTGECINPTSNKCSLDTHCMFTYYCASGSCMPGCRDSGDCPIGFGCRGGTCIQGACATRFDCNLGERCANNECQPGLDSQTCRDCSCSVPGVPCPAYTNCVSGNQHTCLINSAFDPGNSYTAPENYCTANCNTDEDCANGFACAEIFAVLDTCTRGATCDNGAQCMIGSEQSVGYCPCVNDSECTMMMLPGPCTAEGLCLSGRACGIYPNLYCRDVGVNP